MEISEKIDCNFCGKHYEVILHDEDDPDRVQYCSYCGEMIEVDEEEDDNWD